MKLTKKQRDELWGETGPYSQANLKMETRILDDRISRIFLIVDVEINPLTFKIIRQNLKYFENDEIILALIEIAQYKGKSNGYVSCLFQRQYIDKKVLNQAEKVLDVVVKAVARMHQFVMGLLDLK